MHVSRLRYMPVQSAVLPGIQLLHARWWGKIAILLLGVPGSCREGTSFGMGISGIPSIKVSVKFPS
jgi:hypothetical protein